MLNTSDHLSLQKTETLQIHNPIEFADDLPLLGM
jgi:hypothetical protein